MYIQRFLGKKINKYLESKEIIAIVGARQCGKTTLMKHIFDNLSGEKQFITFEDREILKLFTKDIKSFIDLYIKDQDYLFIDEFQYAKKGGKQLKLIYDTHDTKIIISGSSAPDLSFQGIKYLTGRILIFHLYPLSFEEYLNYKDEKLYQLYQKKNITSEIIKRINKHYREFVVYGGYPRVVISKDKEEKKEILKNIYNTYFLREIKEILNLPDNFKLDKLIKVLALQIGGLINYNKICSETDLGYKQLIKNINILEDTYVCIKSNPFYTNKKKELIKAPKIFFVDNGFRNQVLNNFKNFENRTDIGELNENFIGSEITKRDTDLKYWRTKAKAEVDFILEPTPKKTIPIEIKSDLKNKKIPKSFRSYLKKYQPEKGYILSLSQSGQSGKITFEPLFRIGRILS